MARRYEKAESMIRQSKLKDIPEIIALADFYKSRKEYYQQVKMPDDLTTAELFDSTLTNDESPNQQARQLNDSFDDQFIQSLSPEQSYSFASIIKSILSIFKPILPKRLFTTQSDVAVELRDSIKQAFKEASNISPSRFS